MINVLLIEADPQWAERIRALLDDDAVYVVEWMRGAADGLERIARGCVDAVVLDLLVAGITKIDVFDQVALAADRIPIIVLTDAAGEDVVIHATQDGNHDYLLRPDVDGRRLRRALRRAIAARSVNEALEHATASRTAICDRSSLGIFITDADDRCTYSNPAYQKITGLTSDQTLGARWRDAVHAADRATANVAWNESARSGKPFRAEQRFVRSDGAIVWTRVSAAGLTNGRRSLGHVQIVENVTDREAAAGVPVLAGGHAQSTLDSIADGIVTTDNRGDVAYINPAAETMSGWSSEDALGKPFAQVVNIVNGATGVPVADRRLAEGGGSDALNPVNEGVIVHVDGSEAAVDEATTSIRDRSGAVIGEVTVLHDVTESRALAARLAHAARHDVITSLPNRTLLDARMAEAIALAGPQKLKVALLLIDVDRFKDINDSAGHAVGDKLLRSIGQRLVDCAPVGATVYRQGGDEFLVLLPNLTSITVASDLAHTICIALAAPHHIGVHELRVTASLGIAIYPDHGHDMKSIFHHADTAMYYAKDHGGNQATVFAREMSAPAIERLVLERSLQRAIHRRQFVLHYQPKFDLDTGAMAGAEALIRWHHPDLGVVPPGHFIPVAESCGLIVPMGKWVLEEACKQAKQWFDDGFVQALPIAVNVSATQFRQPTFLCDVEQALAAVGLDAQYLELELTESVLMENVDTTLSMLKTLNLMGVRLAIDDFGTGYSSLSYLKQFAIDTLKIDRSFIKGITNDPDDATIVSAVIGMARGLGQRIVAEGIETAEQLAFLQVHECHGGQGFLFSRPLARADFAALMRTWDKASIRSGMSKARA
jgi:diguanylate cyclase (GGDEF)-like protein/PAS domain S-box-containing protein